MLPLQRALGSCSWTTLWEFLALLLHLLTRRGSSCLVFGACEESRQRAEQRWYQGFPRRAQRTSTSCCAQPGTTDLPTGWDLTARAFLISPLQRERREGSEALISPNETNQVCAPGASHTQPGPHTGLRGTRTEMPTQVSLMAVRSRSPSLEQWTVQRGCPAHGQQLGTTDRLHPTPRTGEL